MPLQALYIMHIVREHHNAAFRIHDIVVELLTEAIPQFHGMIVKMRAFVIQIIGADDRRVSSGTSSTNPAFFKHRNIGNAVFFGEVICRAETMAAAANDNRIISWLGRSVGPLLRPILMPAERLGEQA